MNFTDSGNYYVAKAQKADAEVEKAALYFRAISFGCHAKQYVEVYNNVYLPFIKKDVLAHDARMLGGYGTNIDSIACFFKEKWDKLYEFDDEMQSNLFAEASFALMCVGEINAAIRPLEMAIGIEKKTNHFEVIATYYGNLSELFLLSGKIQRAQEIAECGLRYANKSKSVGRHNWAQMTKHATVLCQKGRFAESLKEFQAAELLQRENDPSAQNLYGILAYKMFDVILTEAEDFLIIEQLLEVPHKLRYSLNGLRESINASVLHDEQSGNMLHLGAVYTSLSRLLMVDDYFNGSNNMDEALRVVEKAVKFTLRGGRKEYVLYARLSEAFIMLYYRSETNTEKLITRIEELRSTAKHYSFNLIYIDASVLLVFAYISLDMFERARDELNLFKGFEYLEIYRKRKEVLRALDKYIFLRPSSYKKVSHDALQKREVVKEKSVDVLNNFKNIHK